MLASKLMSALTGGTEDKLYVDDVFSTWLYTGNGSTQTINNGIDLAGKGGMVWIKSRTDGADYHTLHGHHQDTRYGLSSNNTWVQFFQSGSVTSFNSGGFSIGSDGNVNFSGEAYASWTFRKAAKFFDVVTYTGTGNNTSFAHGLQSVPGTVIIKRLDVAQDWLVYRKDLSSGSFLKLNTTAAQASAGSWITVGSNAVTFPTSYDDTSKSGATYVAYLFAHDTSADGIIQCGSFTTDGSGNATVNHGWAKGVQFALLKASSTTGDWEMFDTARTSGWSGNDARLRANLNNAEDSVSRLSASGSNVSFTGLSVGTIYIYMFIVNP